MSIIISLFGANVSVHRTTRGTIGHPAQRGIVVVASFNLMLDFDFIERGAAAGAPKYIEWYAAFGLMVTLVWLYLEMLRLLGKLNSR